MTLRFQRTQRWLLAWWVVSLFGMVRWNFATMPLEWALVFSLVPLLPLAFLLGWDIGRKQRVRSIEMCMPTTDGNIG